MKRCEQTIADEDSEYQTFLQLFTLQTARHWTCRNGCPGNSVSEKWEQALFLPIDVQKPTSSMPHTTIIRGIELGLRRQNMKLRPRRGSVNTVPKCTKCRNICEPQTVLVNLPEILILVRNNDQLESNEIPDIPYGESDARFLHLNKLIRGSTGNEGSYILMTGTARRRINHTRDQAIAFVRGGPEDVFWEWFAISDEYVDRALSLNELDQLQRAHDGDGHPINQRVFPEIFIYARVDDEGKKNTNYNVNIGFFPDPQSPPTLQSAQNTRDLIGRSVTEIFTQKIGQGLLKFKVQLAPADPGPQDSIPFVMDLGYEVNGCYWKTGEKTIGRLQPLNEIANDPQNTPDDLQPVRRYKRRSKGPVTPKKLTPEQQRLDAQHPPVLTYPG